MSEDHANTEANRSSDFFCHGDRIGIGRTMAGLVRWRGSEIRAMDQHKVRAASPRELLRSGHTASISTQVKVVVGDRTLVG